VDLQFNIPNFGGCGEHLFWDFCCVAARIRNHPKLDSAQKKTSVIDAHHPVNSLIVLGSPA